MLTATDVHLLVGFLTVASTPDSVKVELGSMVHDDAAEKNRDVDVTTTLRGDDGRVEAFAGIEVKNETQPLDVQAVEQLSAKLHDMPSLTPRAIVSASGYTAPAAKKAAAHDVELWHLRPWVPHISSPHEESRIIESRLEWLESPKILFNPNDDLSPEIRTAFEKYAPRETLQRVLKSADKEFRKRYSQQFVPGHATPVNLHCTLTNPVSVELGEAGSIELREVLITGVLRKVESGRDIVLKALVRDGEEWPYGACLLAELTGGQLVGVFMGQRSVNLIAISVSLRNQNAIRRLHLR